MDAYEDIDNCYAAVNKFYDQLGRGSLPFFVSAKVKGRGNMERSVISVETSQTVLPQRSSSSPDGVFYLVQRIYDTMGRPVVEAPLVAVEKMFVMQLMSARNYQADSMVDVCWKSMFSEVWTSITPGVFLLHNEPDDQRDVVVSFKRTGGAACPLVEWGVEWKSKYAVKGLPLLRLAQYIPEQDIDVEVMSRLISEYHQNDSDELGEHLWSCWVNMNQVNAHEELV